MTRTDRRGNPGARLTHAAVAAGILLASGACTQFRVPYKSEHEIRIAFKGTCADEVDTQERNCDASRPKDCLRAHSGDTLVFQAYDEKGAQSKNDFEIRFGPVRETAIRSSAGTTQKLRLDAPTAPNKPYHFNVYTVDQTSCRIIDPQIIIDY